MAAPSPPSGRVKSLDVLRGIAILLVGLNHARPDAIPGLPQLTGVAGFLYWKLRLLGWTGVDLFFVLSGFLIGGLLLNELTQTGRIHVVRFWVRREFKILPSYYFLLFVLALCSVTSWIRWDSPAVFLKGLFTHLFFLQNYLDQETNGPTWSLAIEEHFYFLLPLALILGAGRSRDAGRNPASRVPFLAVLIVIACLISRVAAESAPHRNHFMLSHLRADSLFLGVLCQFLWHTRREACLRWASRPALWLLAALILILPSAFTSPHESFLFSVKFLGVACGYAILLMLVIARGLGRWEHLRVTKGIAAVGVWSYNIYLWHWFWPRMNLPLYAQIQTSWSRVIPWDPLVLVVQIALYLGISILVGYVLTVAVERPFLRLRDRILPSRVAPVKMTG